jgi:divinyl protochlorophyllide a 8-vinyl-reductase
MTPAQHSISDRRARFPRSAEPGAAAIGPNAATQLLVALHLAVEPSTIERILADAGAETWMADPPHAMVDERRVAGLHKATRALLGRERSETVLREAGSLTADYLLEARIPHWARAILTALPASGSARVLTRAIQGHAWTFAGSGRFSSANDRGLRYEIWSNPLCAGERAPKPVCVWHAAVFQRLFQALVSPAAHVVETHCRARGDDCCRFSLNWRPQ